MPNIRDLQPDTTVIRGAEEAQLADAINAMRHTVDTWMGRIARALFWTAIGIWFGLFYFTVYLLLSS